MKFKGIFGAFVVLATQSHGATITLTASDALGSSSFNSAGNWSNLSAPSAGNDYVTNGQLMRSPANNSSLTFAGDSLTISAGQSFISKASGARTLTANWILDGGLFRGGAGTIVEGYAGTMRVTSNGGTIQADQADIVIDASLSGDGVLQKTQARGMTLNGANTMSSSGGINVTGGTVSVFGDYSGFEGTFTHNSTTTSTIFYNTNSTGSLGNYVISSTQGGSQGMLLGFAAGGTYQMGSLSGVGNSLVRNVNAVTGTSTLEVGNLGTNTEFAGIIGGGGGTIALTKVGTGVLTLSGASSYAGDTLVSEGSLLVTGSLGATSVTVDNGAAIGGNGVLGGDLTFSAGGMLDLTGATLGLSSTGILSVGAGGTITLDDFAFADIIGWDAANAADGTYTLIDGGLSTSLGGSTPTISNPYAFSATRFGYFQQGSLQAVVFTIPEPSVALLGSLALVGLLRRRR